MFDVTHFSQLCFLYEPDGDRRSTGMSLLVLISLKVTGMQFEVAFLLLTSIVGVINIPVL